MKPQRIFIILNFLIFNLYNVNSQSLHNNKLNDSIIKGSFIKKSILPASLIGLGVVINNSHFEKKFQTDLRNKVGNSYEFRIDDYVQFMPIAEMYIADAFKIKAKNHWFDQTKYLFISNFISSAITHSLKRITNKTRPNGSLHSFPSGHTTFAFTNATVLYNEFKDTSPFLAYSGYAFATTTASFRMLNNKHWMSDVLVGAGVGILVTQLVYYIKPLKNFNPFKERKGVTMVPFLDNKHFGVFAQIIF
jgi:hypothetical protein